MPSTTPPRPLDKKAIFYMSLLALQFGIQPILTRRYTPTGITRSTVVLVQELLKFVIALTMLRLSGSTAEALKGWNVGQWIAVAGIPAGLYAVQNIAALKAYQNLDALTFNVLNQTKTLSAALCCYLVMGRRQSAMQVFSLLLLLVSALVMEGIIKVEWVLSIFEEAAVDAAGNDDEKDNNKTSPWDARHFTHGVAPLLLASFISGLAGALSQKNLQASGGGRNAYLFSMELCAASVIVLSASLVLSPDGQVIQQHGFWKGWTPQTLIPIFTNSCGGIIVGLVIKYAGSVRKGFALIFGILLSGIIQALLLSGQGVTKEQVLGGLIAAVSLFLHATNPPSAGIAPKKAAKQD